MQMGRVIEEKQRFYVHEFSKVNKRDSFRCFFDIGLTGDRNDFTEATGS
jgi:hypothetical protein